MFRRRCIHDLTSTSKTAKAAVLNSHNSADAKRGYRHAIDEFVDWYCSDRAWEDQEEATEVEENFGQESGADEKCG